MLVGRERQLGQLRAQVDALATGRGGLLLVVGQAGIGKTRLAEEADALARRAGADTHWVTGWAEAGAPPFWPWSQFLGALGADPLDSTADDRDRELARFRRFTAVADALRRAGAHQPRLLVLDDLHWADPPSVRLLAFLAPVLRDAAVLVLATYRDTEVDGPSDLAAVLPELIRHGRQLAIPPLDRDEFGALLGELTARPVRRDLVERLYTLTAGNPLYTREVVSLLDAQGALDGRAVTEIPVPESIRATLTRRFETVSPECRRMLDVASVVGVEFGSDLLGATTGLDASTLLRTFDEAEDARLVSAAGAGRYAFTHPLIRETAYRNLGLANRVRLHAEIADALERERDRTGAIEPAALAYHFFHSSADGRADKAAAYTQMAGEQAMAMLAYEAAAAHFEQALDALARCAPDPARRAELLLRLGDARSAAGDLPGARVAFDKAAALARAEGRVDQLARAALGYGSGTGGFEVPPFDDRQTQLLREAITALADRDPVTRSWLLARLSVALSLDGSETERRALADEAIALARVARDDRALAHALAAHCDVVAGPAFCAQRLQEAGEIVTLSRTHGDARGELLGRRLRVLALAELGRFEELDAEVDAYARLCDAVRQPLYSWYVPLWRGMRALMDGRFDDAADWCTEAEAIGASAHSDNAEMLTMSLRLVMSLFLGSTDETSTLALHMVAGHPELTFMVQPGLALANARGGNDEAARARLLTADVSDPAAWGAEWLPAVAQAAEATGLCGEPEQAVALYDDLLPYRHLFAIDGIAAANLGSVEHFLGMLAARLRRVDDARAHFDAALAAHRAIRSPVLEERTLRDMELLLAPDPEARRARSGAFRREGEVWALSYEGRTVRMRHTKGIADLARLIAQPGTEIHVLDLASDGQAVAVGGTGPQLDATARAAFKRRLVELEDEIEAADALADAGRSHELHAERDAILAELAGAYGLGGRARRVGDPAERARSAVTQRMREAMGRIESEHSPLGTHLRRAVKTGVFCVYEPDGPVEWEVSRS